MNPTSCASIPSGRDKPGWYAEHDKHVEVAKSSSARVLLLIGNSLIHGLVRYPKVWNQYFSPLKTLNFGLCGNKIQHVLWRIKNGEITLKAQTIVLHVGTNNIDRDQPRDIANGIGSIAVLLQEARPNAKIILTGLLPRGLQPSIRRMQVDKVKIFCTIKDFLNFYKCK